MIKVVLVDDHAVVRSGLRLLLDKQDEGESALTDDERLEAEGLVELVDLLSLLRLRATRVADAER